MLENDVEFYDIEKDIEYYDIDFSGKELGIQIKIHKILNFIVRKEYLLTIFTFRNRFNRATVIASADSTFSHLEW